MSLRLVGEEMENRTSQGYIRLSQWRDETAVGGSEEVGLIPRKLMMKLAGPELGRTLDHLYRRNASSVIRYAWGKYIHYLFGVWPVLGTSMEIASPFGVV